MAYTSGSAPAVLRDRRAAVRPDFVALIRLVLVLAARGDVLIVGRGAGFLLPTETTLNVRIIAPREERIAYLAQWLRLPPEAAKAEMDKRDRVRSELHAELADRDSNDLSQYDILLNSGRLDEATCAELIAQAIRAKQLPEPADSELDSAG